MLFRCQSCAELKEGTSKTVPEGCWTGKAFKTCHINQTLWCQYSISYNANKKFNKEFLYWSFWNVKLLKNSLMSKFNMKGVVRCRKGHLKRLHCSRSLEVFIYNSQHLPERFFLLLTHWMVIHNIYLVFVFSRHPSKREWPPVTISVIKVKNMSKKVFLCYFFFLFGR